MNARRIVERAEALSDIEAASDYYLLEGGEAVAIGFLDALEAAYREISEFPALGSPYYRGALDIENLRHLPLRRYPFIVFYIEREDHVDIWRVIHGQRDIPFWLQD
jgi:toxin ParE1/3/4